MGQYRNAHTIQDCCLDLGGMTLQQMIALYSAIEHEFLCVRGVAERRNELAGAYAQELVAYCLGLELAPPGNPGNDAGDPNTGDRYQIKGRRAQNENVETSGIGNLENEPPPFEFLVAVVFDYECNAIHRALAVPLGVVRRRARRTRNGFQLRVGGAVIRDNGVINLTERLRDCKETFDNLPVQRMREE